MAQRPILRSQANEVFESIRSTGLDPSEFAWSTQLSPAMYVIEVSKLTHKPTGYYFLFDFAHPGTETHRFEYTPSEQSNISVSGVAATWPAQVAAAKIHEEIVDVHGAVTSERRKFASRLRGRFKTKRDWEKSWRPTGNEL